MRGSKLDISWVFDFHRPIVLGFIQFSEYLWSNCRVQGTQDLVWYHKAHDLMGRKCSHQSHSHLNVPNNLAPGSPPLRDLSDVPSLGDTPLMGPLSPWAYLYYHSYHPEIQISFSLLSILLSSQGRDYEFDLCVPSTWYSAWHIIGFQ